MSNMMFAISIVSTALVLVQLVSAFSCPETCNCQLDWLNCRNASLHLIPVELDIDTTAIDFSFNRISIIYNHDLSSATNVETLLLNNNEINEVQPYCFYRTKKLKHLYLNSNRISILDADIFKFLTKLRYLSLKNNDLLFLDLHIFQQNNDLVMLDLGENKIKALNPNIFENNSVLSWVSLKNNPLPFSTEWGNLFNNSLNVIDFDFCKGHNTSIIELRTLPILRKNKTKSKDFVTLENFTSFRVTGMSESETSQLKYKLLHELYDMEFSSIFKLVLAEDWNVVTLSGETILCYCEQISAWFWCHDTSSACHVTKAEKYKMLNCSDQNADVMDFTESTTADDSKRSKIHDLFYRTVSGKTLRNTLLYGSIPGCLAIMVLTAYIVKRIRRRKASEEREREQSYSALRNSYSYPPD